MNISGGIRVKEVAARVGYGSAAAFSRAYERKFSEPREILGKRRKWQVDECLLSALLRWPRIRLKSTTWRHLAAQAADVP